MAHSSTMRWDEAQNLVSASAQELLDALLRAESRYQELFEVYQYSGATDQALADQLFQDLNGNPVPITGTATAEQVAMIADLRAAIQAMHQLYEAADNVVTAQADRIALLRRMS